jgi:peptidoglycan/LPS O-acetylase OafA/YrhL
MPSISAKAALDKFGGLGPGFDTWRFGLSTSIVFLHSFFVCYGRDSPISSEVGRIGTPIFVAILPIFFGLSGFLVAASAARAKSVVRFLSFRALRLVPALAVETALAALLLGPLVTTSTFKDYFTSGQFFAYFGNMVGRVRYGLPGVFLANPEPGIVNMNLWTLHAELQCYALMALAIAVGLLKRRRLAIAVWIFCTVTAVCFNLTSNLWENETAGSLYQPPIFVYSFCTCVVAYLWADRIPLHKMIFAGCCVGFTGLVYVPHSVFLVVPMLAYIMIYVGLSPRAEIRILKRGDYSYGIYLYSFVIQQTITQVPSLRHWWVMFPATMVVTIAIASLSWNLVEKPALAMKRFIPDRYPFLSKTPSPATSDRYCSVPDQGRA